MYNSQNSYESKIIKIYRKQQVFSLAEFKFYSVVCVKGWKVGIKCFCGYFSVLVTQFVIFVKTLLVCVNGNLSHSRRVPSQELFTWAIPLPQSHSIVTNITYTFGLIKCKFQKSVTSIYVIIALSAVFTSTFYYGVSTHRHCQIGDFEFVRFLLVMIIAMRRESNNGIHSAFFTNQEIDFIL